MSKGQIKIKLQEVNFKGYNKLRKSNEIRDFMKKKSEEIKSRCGSGYETDVKYMSREVMCSIYTATPESKKDNLDNNTLLKASRV